MPVRDSAAAIGVAGLLLLVSADLSAQDVPAASANTAAAQPDSMPMPMPAASNWMLMQDGILFASVNRQGGLRGGTEVDAPNWWMGMASRSTSRGRLTFNAMISLDPATVGENGYRELFQAGEALNGRPLIDRQHPHDMFMQLAAIWSMSVGRSTGLTVAGGPAGEPALGPVAFMHRASAADNPTAPLSHHTFDSTHIAFGVVTTAVDHGPWVVEGSLFNGREPDQNRWDIDFGRLDSVSGRVWYRPNSEWEFQASAGHLKEPEELEPGQNLVRSTASAAWTRTSGSNVSAITIGVGRNDTEHGARSGVFAEAARQTGAHTLYTRVEGVQVETAVLLTGAVPEDAAAAAARNAVAALTIGGVQKLFAWRGFEGGLGADVTVYGVPTVLQPMYSAHPVSIHVFFRLRPPAGSMGRMWNMRMSQPMAGHMMGPM
jgi:hypothetical protein